MKLKSTFILMTISFATLFSTITNVQATYDVAIEIEGFSTSRTGYISVFIAGNQWETTYEYDAASVCYTVYAQALTIYGVSNSWISVTMYKNYGDACEVQLFSGSIYIGSGGSGSKSFPNYSDTQNTLVSSIHFYTEWLDKPSANLYSVPIIRVSSSQQSGGGYN